MRSLPAAVLALAALCATAPACDLKPRVSTDLAREQWAELGPQRAVRVAELRQRQTVLGGRVGALTVPAGVEDPALTAAIADLQQQVAGFDAAIAALETQTAQISTEVEAALAAPDKISARRAVEAAGPRLDQALAQARVPFDQLEPRLPELEAAVQRHATAIQAEQQRFDRIATHGGDIDLPALGFAAGTAQLELGGAAPRASLARLVAFAGTCPELRVTITAADDGGADARANRALAVARAEAVRAQLVAAGVPAERLAVSTTATTGPRPVGVNVAVTTPCPDTGHTPPAAPTAEINPIR